MGRLPVQENLQHRCNTLFQRARPHGSSPMFVDSSGSLLAVDNFSGRLYTCEHPVCGAFFFFTGWRNTASASASSHSCPPAWAGRQCFVQRVSLILSWTLGFLALPGHFRPVYASSAMHMVGLLLLMLPRQSTGLNIKNYAACIPSLTEE